MTVGGIGRFSAEFVREYDLLYAQRQKRFEIALSQARNSIEAVLDDEEVFSPSQRMRIRVEPGRVKQRDRLLAKAALPRYEDRIGVPADIFRHITDIAGMRITCNTVFDIRAVVEELKKSSTLPPPSWIDPSKCLEDYITAPKASGYRAVHLLVGVKVPCGREFEEFPCEIQIRTLLQHAWGELTHEDTFKVEFEVPELVAKLSTRLATTLAVLDDIAQDLRDELERFESTASESERDMQPPVSSIPSAIPVAELFERVFGRTLILSGKTGEETSAQLAAFQGTEVELEKALESVRYVWREQFSKQPIPVSDADLALIALQSGSDRKEIAVRLKGSVEATLRQIERHQQFLDDYQPGREMLGTVTRVNRNYALVRLPGQATGILSSRNIQWFPRNSSLTRYLRQGDTVRVIVVNCQAETERLEIAPTQQLIERPKAP